MQHDAYVRAEIDYRRASLLAEADEHRRQRQALATRPGTHSRLVAAVVHLAPRSLRQQHGHPRQRAA